MGEFYRWRALRVAQAGARSEVLSLRQHLHLSALLIKQIPVLAKLM
jgi:hypothetical protein